MENNLGIFGEIPDDPRVKAAMDAATEGAEKLTADNVVPRPPPAGLAKYGLTFRPQNLMFMSVMAKITGAGVNDPRDIPWAWLFASCAPLETVYEVAEIGRQRGPAVLMARVHEWYNSLGLPPETSQQIFDDHAESFKLAEALGSKLGMRAEETAGPKKNGPPGS